MPDQALARIVITLDCRRDWPERVATTLFSVRLYNRPIHYLHRTLEGARGEVFQLPLCWHADAASRNELDYAEDLWWISVDHGSLDLDEHVGSFCRDLVTCTDCLEWLRS